MSDISPLFLTESVDAWENSSLDGRIYDVGQSVQNFEPAASSSATTMIEASYHAAAANEFDAAAAILYKYVYAGPLAWITSVFGGYEVALGALTNFFPFRDLSLDPRPKSAEARRWILHETALCLHVVGRLESAAALAERAVDAALTLGDKHSAAITYHNMCETYLASGLLRQCRISAEASLRLAKESRDQEDLLVANTVLGRIADLSTQHDVASRAYESALQIAAEDTPFPVLYSLSGVRYAEFLRNTNQSAEAFQVALKNLAFCEEQHWQSDVALIRSQLATFHSSLPVAELERYSQDAIDLARSVGHKAVLAETLLAHAGLDNQKGDSRDAIIFASEALTIAQLSGLRLVEVDTRIQLAVAFMANRNKTNANAEAHLAFELAATLGYTRGRLDAEEKLRSVHNL